MNATKSIEETLVGLADTWTVFLHAGEGKPVRVEEVLSVSVDRLRYHLRSSGAPSRSPAQLGLGFGPGRRRSEQELATQVELAEEIVRQIDDMVLEAIGRLMMDEAACHYA